MSDDLARGVNEIELVTGDFNNVPVGTQNLTFVSKSLDHAGAGDIDAWLREVAMFRLWIDGDLDIGISFEELAATIVALAGTGVFTVHPIAGQLLSFSGP